MSTFKVISLTSGTKPDLKDKTDFYGFSDLKNNADLTDSKFAVLQKCFRVLDTPRGALFYSPNYGSPIYDILGDSQDEGSIRVVLSRCENAIVRFVSEVLDVRLSLESFNEAAKKAVITMDVVIASGALGASFEVES